MALPNPISWQNRFTVEPVQSAALNDAALTPYQASRPLATQQIYIVICTPDEFTQILSAAQTGAELRYPDRSNYLLELLNMSNQYDLTQYLCDVLAECLTNGGAFADALAQWLNDNGCCTDIDSPPSGAGTNLLSATQCDEDSRYGAIVAVYDYIREVARDLLNVVVSQADEILAVLALIDAIPVIGDFPVVDDVNDIVNWMRFAGIQSFDTGDTVALRQDIICDLFCRTADCDLTAEAILASFATLGGIDLNLDDALGVIWLALTDALGDTAFFLGMMSAAVVTLAADASVLDASGLVNIKVVAQLSAPSDGWELLCDDCPQANDAPNWVLIQDAGFTPPSRGEYQPDDQTWTDTRNVRDSDSESIRGIRISRAIGAGESYSQIIVDYGYLAGQGAGISPSTIQHYRGGVLQAQTVIGQPPADTSDASASLSSTIVAGDELRINFVVSRVVGADGGGSATVRYIQLVP